MTRTDGELISVVLAGDQAGFAELVRRYERAVWARAWHVLRDYHGAQDATQNTFLEAFRGLRQLRDGAQFGGWLMRIAENEALRTARKQARGATLEPPTEIAAGEAPPRPAAETAELLAAVGELPDHERVVVSLRYLNGHSVAEVARLTGRPVGTVTKQLSRAIERLKSILREVET